MKGSHPSGCASLGGFVPCSDVCIVRQPLRGAASEICLAYCDIKEGPVPPVQTSVQKVVASLCGLRPYRKFRLGKATTTNVLTDEEFDSFLKALGVHVRRLRKEKNVNMRDIMIETGFYDSQWRKYESGGGLNLRSLMKIAQALKVTLVELLDGLGQWPRFSVKEIQERHHIVPEPQPDSVHEAVAVIKLKPRRSKPAKKVSAKQAAKKKAANTGGSPARRLRKPSK